jgi:hypothetical protein
MKLVKGYKFIGEIGKRLKISRRHCSILDHDFILNGFRGQGV